MLEKRLSSLWVGQILFTLAKFCWSIPDYVLAIYSSVLGGLLTVAGFESSMNCRRLKTMGWRVRLGIRRGRTRRTGRSIRSNPPRPETLSHGQSHRSYEENSPEKLEKYT